MILSQINSELKNSFVIKILSYFSIFLFIFSSYFKTKTLAPWNDEIVSLISNLNFYYNNFNFIGPFGTEYFYSYSPKLTAGPISSLGGIIGWLFSHDIYVLRFSNLIYLIFLSLSLSIFVFKNLKLNVKLNFLVLTALIIFSLTNTSWWYSVLYLLPETICAVIFVNSVLLFGTNRKVSLFLMSLSVFFGDFLTILMFLAFYLATIYYEKSLINILKDVPFAILPLVLWIYLVLTFSEYNISQYLVEYYEHYFEHPSGGELNFSLSSIINNFTSSEVSDWGVSDFLRVLIAPILFIYVTNKIKESPLDYKLGKLQITLPILFIYLWFWLLSPAKSIIYSGLFTTVILIFNTYFLLFAKFSNKVSFFMSLIIYSFFLSTPYLVVFYLILSISIMFSKKIRVGKNVIVISILLFIVFNQLNVVYEMFELDTFEVSLKSCIEFLEDTKCLEDYYNKQ